MLWWYQLHITISYVSVNCSLKFSWKWFMINVHITGLPQRFKNNIYLTDEDFCALSLQALLKTISIKISMSVETQNMLPGGSRWVLLPRQKFRNYIISLVKVFLCCLKLTLWEFRTMWRFVHPCGSNAFRYLSFLCQNILAIGGVETNQFKIHPLCVSFINSPSVRFKMSHLWNSFLVSSCFSNGLCLLRNVFIVRVLIQGILRS